MKKIFTFLVALLLSVSSLWAAQTISLTKSEVWLCVGLSVLTVGAFVFFYNKIFAVTFDGDFARATGPRAGLYQAVIAVIVAVSPGSARLKNSTPGS